MISKSWSERVFLGSTLWSHSACISRKHGCDHTQRWDRSQRGQHCRRTCHCMNVCPHAFVSWASLPCCTYSSAVRTGTGFQSSGVVEGSYWIKRCSTGVCKSSWVKCERAQRRLLQLIFFYTDNFEFAPYTSWKHLLTGAQRATSSFFKNKSK